MSDVQDVRAGQIVGRRAELARVLAAFDRAACRGVFLVGAAGIGKTRLADECRRLAQSRDFAVVSVAANAASSRLSLGALSHILPPASALGDLHHDLQPAHLLQAARHMLAAEAGSRRLLLSIDDAHHLDPVSAQLVHQLVAVDSAFVIATVRSGEKLPEPIADLLKDTAVERLDIDALPSSDVAPLAAFLLGGAVDAELASWLAGIADGNALFLRELVLSGRDDGTIALDVSAGVWRLAPGPRAASPRLTDLLEYRLEGLDPTERRGVELVGLAEPLPLELAEELLGIDCLDALDRRGLIRVVADGRRLRIGLCHPLYSEALRRAPMTLRRRADLGALAAMVEARGARRRDDAVRLAGWQLARGGRADPAVLMRAALAAQLGFDDHRAIDLASAGLDHDPDPTVCAELLLCRGLAQSRLGRFSAAFDDLERAVVHATTPDQASRAAIRLAAATLEHRGDLDGALVVLDAALERLGEDPSVVDVRLERATLLADGGMVRAARAELALLSSVALSGSQQVVLALAEASVELNAGYPLVALRRADRGLHDHLSSLDEATTYHPASHFLPRILALIDAGQLDQAEHDAGWLRDRSVAERRPIAQSAGTLFVAMAQLQRGRARTVLAVVEQAQSAMPPDTQPYLRRFAWALRAQALVILGESAGARTALDRFDAEVRVVDGFTVVDRVLATAAVLRANGDAPEAEALLRSTVTEAAEAGNDRMALAALDELTHTFGDVEAASALATLAEGRPDPRSAARRALAASVLDPSSYAAAEAAVSAYAAIGMELRAAEIAQRAAERAASSGQGRRAALLSGLAAEAAARGEGGAASLLGVGASVPLTDREREIAVYVAGGATSKEVGARLHLSARTVDNHLQRIFTKLGVSSRRELANRLGPVRGPE